MKILIIGITFLVAFHVGNVEAAQWMPLDEAEDRQLIRTNQSPEEGRIICTSKTRGGKGIANDGRRLGFLTKKGCKTIGGGDKVRWFKRENGDIMVLVDDEPAVQDVQEVIDSALEGMVPEEDVQAKIDEALVGMVSEHDVQAKIDEALVGMVAEADVTPLNCSDGTAVNDAGDACEPTAEYRAAAFEEGRDEGFAAGAASVVIGTHEFKSGVAPDPLFVDACGGPACNQEGQVCYSTDESHHVSHAIRVCRSERWTDVLLSDRCKYVWALEQGGLSWPNGGAPFHFGGCSEQPRYDDEWRSKLNICQPSVNAEGFYRDPCADEELNTCMAECRDR